MEPMTTVKRQYQKMQCKMRILILAVFCFFLQATIHPSLGQPMNAICQGTKSTLTIGCTFYKNVSITLELKCKGQELHSVTCWCRESNCECPRVNYSVTENSPTKREIVIFGLNCEPEILHCNPFLGDLDSHLSSTLTNCSLTSQENKESSQSVLLVVLVTIFIVIGAIGGITLAVCWKNCCGIRDKFSGIGKTKKVTYGHQDEENTYEPWVQNVEARTLSSHTAEQELSEKGSTELGIVSMDLYSPVIEQSVSCMWPEAESAIVPSGASRQVENKYRVDHQELPTGAMENNGAMTCRVHMENIASS